MTADATANSANPDPLRWLEGAKAWSFFWAGIHGFMLYLNDNWQLTVDYRLRYLSGNVT